MNESENKYLSLKTAAELYGYTRDHLGLMIRQGKLNGIKLGSYYVTTSEWMTDYLKKYADLGHPIIRGKFSNKFLAQVFTAKGNAEKKVNIISPDSIEETKIKTLQKELLPSLRELSATQEKTSALLVSSAISHINSGNPYVILPIRQMKESERESILRKTSDSDKSNNKQEVV
ncbi:hypothetical protein A2819_00995 [Candidatus Azambacteria bacterium RIFCSPHIGHO2_01_FULL_40_24]|uniref:Helix-turn-helix domain-containing protein n=1 Tax=Candidatus Azambacteria bacterium RIFCSPHIGHO2_01_FULL_40_24 TaxID=1797301 RepID=A0A1F5B2I5_9BACT|nr:MAG: hypothetical protein A2819_00995 [Candidatus Azambacteria bacterium RIFCSPHIGHO2_01_FULL_40_24]